MLIFHWIHYTSDVGIVTEPSTVCVTPKVRVAALTLFLATSRYPVFHTPILT
jgi:hypothetical protein